MTKTFCDVCGGETGQNFAAKPIKFHLSVPREGQGTRKICAEVQLSSTHEPKPDICYTCAMRVVREGEIQDVASAGVSV